MGGFPIPCWYVRDGYKPRLKALMLSVPSDRTLIVLESGDLRYIKAHELALKPCPFCGQPITRNPYTRPDVGSRIRQGVIRCDCGAEMRIHVVSRDAAERRKRLGYHFHPDDVAYGGDDNDVDAVIKFTKDELVKQWNSRSGGNE